MIRMRPESTAPTRVCETTNERAPQRGPAAEAPVRDFGAFGSLVLFAGLALLTMCIIESVTGLRGMPRAWHTNRPIWWLLSFLGIAGGAYWLRPLQATMPVTRWRPTQSGLRFRQLVVYTRNGCHLCDEAITLLTRHRRWLPDVTVIDIDHDPRLVEKYGHCVPVVQCDGKVRFRGRVSTELLHRLIEGTPPLGP
jgi:glutaredoxin